MSRLKTLFLVVLFMWSSSYVLAHVDDCEKEQGNHKVEICQQTRQRGHFDPVKFRQDLEAYISKEAGLTEAEARQFFPLFHQSKKELRDLGKKIALASYRVKSGKMTEAECDKALRDIEKYRSKSAEIQNTATKRWRKILPASKILKVINAEHNFGKRTFRTMVGSK